MSNEDISDIDLEEKPDNINEDEEGEMPIFGHLKELRNRIIFSLIAVVCFSAIAGVFHKYIINELVLAPAENAGMNLINLKVFGQPIFYFKIILVAGIIAAIPFILYQLWRFIQPALYKNEIRSLKLITLLSFFFFIAGISFAYIIIIPNMLSFVQTFQTSSIENNIDLNSYLSFIILIVVSLGILFETPVATLLLAKAGLITHKQLLHYWRHAIVAILILAAVITPTPDPVSQLIFATPLFFLYLLSIIIAKIVAPKEINVKEVKDESC